MMTVPGRSPPAGLTRSRARKSQSKRSPAVSAQGAPDSGAAAALPALERDDMLPTSDSTCLMFTLEAVVGAGKSTTLHSMKESLPQALGADQVHEVQGRGFSYMQLPQDLTLVFIPEAVEDWMAAGCLQDFYTGELDPKPFQLLTLFSVTTRLAAAAAATSHYAFRVFIQERSIGSNDEVFAASLKAADVEFGKAYDCCVKLSHELLPQDLLRRVARSMPSR